MDYQRHYERLIERARHRSLDIYVEVHHVVPRCMGGSDDDRNLVRLTPEEHFVAHQLLHKIHPKVAKLAYSLIVMLGNPHGGRSNKLYGWIRRKHSRNVSEQMKALWNDPEYREKTSAGIRSFMSKPEHRQRISAIHKGRAKSKTEIANFVRSKTGMKYKPMSAEARANMSEARRRVWAERKARGQHLEIAAKIKATRILNGSYKFTDSHRAAISAAQKGKIISPEQRAKISASLRRH